MSAPRIIAEPLLIPDIEEKQQRYGLQFIAPTIAEFKAFERLCDRLIAQHPGTIELDKPAVYYQPVAFLKHPLTAQQVSAINDQETDTVSNYCLKIQAELAKVPIQESYEKLVHLPSAFNSQGLRASFSKLPYPDVAGEWAGRPQLFWARQGFADRLVILGQLLKTLDLQLHFEEAFRPVGVQESMFRRRVHRTRTVHPRWSESQIMAESKSKTAYTPRLSSHKGGAAVDVFLSDLRGNLLDFGHGYPDGGAIVFPRTPFLTASQWYNRQLLQVAAGLSDLTLYVGEDWHLSYGDNLASLDEFDRVKSGYIAKYGPIKEFDPTSGDILATYNENELDSMYAC